MLIVTNFTATHVIFLLFHKLPLLRFPQTLKVPWEAEIGPVGLFDALQFTQTNRVQLGFRCKNGDVFYYCEVPLEPGWEMSAWIIVPHAIFHLAASRDDTGVRDLFTPRLYQSDQTNTAICLALCSSSGVHVISTYVPDPRDRSPTHHHGNQTN